MNNIKKLVISDESTQLKFFAVDEISDIDIVETHKHIVEKYILL